MASATAEVMHIMRRWSQIQSMRSIVLGRRGWCCQDRATSLGAAMFTASSTRMQTQWLNGLTQSSSFQWSSDTPARRNAVRALGRAVRFPSVLTLDSHCIAILFRTTRTPLRWDSPPAQSEVVAICAWPTGRVAHGVLIGRSGTVCGESHRSVRILY